MTAIHVEHEAVLKVDAGAMPGSAWRAAKQPNGVAMAYRAFEAPGRRPLQVAVAVALDMATAEALATLIPLIERLGPRCIAMCGVCAERPGKMQLGDVIAAERLYYHDAGKQTREDGEPKKLEQARDFADHLRRRHNNGAHTAPRFGFEDHSEIAELLVSSSRHLPSLWSLR